MYYHRDGTPAKSIEEVAYLWRGNSQEDFDKTRGVARTDVNDEVSVSTVFLVMNHAYDDGPPMIFETMVFGGEHDNDCWRYSTEDEARAGHDRIVKALREECANCGHYELDHGMDAWLDDEGVVDDEFRAECCVDGCDCLMYREPSKND